MLVEAIYDNGRLLLPKEWSFVHSRFNVKVDFPEAEIINCAYTIKTLQEMEQINPESLQSELRSIYKAAIFATDCSDDQLTEKLNSRWASALMYSSTKSC